MDLSKEGNLQTRVVDGVAVIGFKRGCLRDENDILFTLESLNRYVSDKESLRILLDMSHVAYLSSAGLGHLVGLLKKLKATGGELKVCSLHETIQELFSVMRLNTIFEIFPDQESALATFQETEPTS